MGAKRFAKFILIMVLLASAPVHGADKPAKTDPIAKAAASARAMELRLGLRDQWIDHIFWARNYAVAVKEQDEEAAKAADDQVFRNATAISATMSPFYGKIASDVFLRLFGGHWAAIKDYVAASAAADQAAMERAQNELMNNAGQIADYLSKANPNWSRQAELALLRAHAGHHIAQVDALFKDDYSADAKVWTEMKDNVYELADSLETGIIKQFPKKF